MNMGLTAEIVPLTHPGLLESGDSLEVILMLHGKPLPDQVVIAGRQGGIPGEPDGRLSLRSGTDGKVTIPIHDNGEWPAVVVKMPFYDPMRLRTHPK